MSFFFSLASNSIVITSVTKESLIEVESLVKTVDNKVESCTQQDVELHIKQVQSAQEVFLERNWSDEFTFLTFYAFTEHPNMCKLSR